MLDEAADHTAATGNHGPAGNVPPERGLVVLTPRELEVLQMISSGLTNAEAARRLHLTVHAIKFHLASIYRRLGVNNRTEAAVTYLRFMSANVDVAPQSD